MLSADPVNPVVGLRLNPPEGSGVPGAVFSAAPDRLGAEAYAGTPDSVARFRAAMTRQTGLDPRTTADASGKYGPFAAYYSNVRSPGSRSDTFGGSLNTGLLSAFLERNAERANVIGPEDAQYFTNPNFERRTDAVGLSGQTPFAGGALSGGASRQFFYDKYPQHMYQESRPTYSLPPVSQYDAQYQRPVGRGIASLGVNLMKPRGGPTDLGANVGYSREDPFGLGGTLTASGNYRNSPGQKSYAGANLGYRLRF
jgi:hypothetical protein